MSQSYLVGSWTGEEPQLVESDFPASNSHPWLETTFMGPRSDTGQRITAERTLEHTPFWHGMMLLSGDVGSLDILMKQRESERTFSLNFDHDAYALLALEPNEFMVPNVFWELMIIRAIIWGNTLCEIPRFNSGRPIPTDEGGGFCPLNPDQTRPWFDEDGKLWIRTRFINAAGGQEESFIDPFDTFHIQNVTTDGFWGRAVTKVGRNRLANGLGLLKQHNRFMGQGMQPDWLFAFPDVVADADRDAFENMLVQRNKGLDNVGRSLIMDQNPKAQQLGMTFEAAQFKELVELDVIMVAGLLGIPAPMLNAMSAMTFRNTEEMERWYINRTLRRWNNKICQEARRKLLTPAEQRIFRFEHDMSPLLKGRLRERYAAYSQAIASEWLSPDDVRFMENMNPRPDGEGDTYQNPNTRGNESPTGVPGQTEQMARLLSLEIGHVMRREDASLERACRREKNIVEWIDRYYQEKLLPELRAVSPQGAEQYCQYRKTYWIELTGKVATMETLSEIVNLQKITASERIASLLNKEVQSCLA